MTIRARTGFVLILVALLIMISAGVTANIVFSRSFDQLEVEQTTSLVNQTRKALRELLETLGKSNHTYAVWDETYAFVQTRDQYYIDSNYNNTAFQNLEVDIAVLLNTDGQPIVARGGPRDAVRDLAFNDPVVQALSTGGPITPLVRQQRAFEGMLLIRNMPWLFSGRPILKSDGTGPARGMMLLGQQLDATLIRHLAQITELNIKQVSPAFVAAVRQGPHESDDIVPVVIEDEVRITGYLVENGLDNTPAVALAINHTRAIHARGINVLTYYGLVLIGLTVVLTLIALFLLDRFVLRRLTTLSTQVAAVATDSSTRVTVSGDDEIGRVAQTINATLDTLQQTEQHLRASKDAAEAANITKSQFLANMSHELRTPLTAVLGYASLIELEAKSQNQETILHDVTNLRQSGQHLLTLINDLLDMARIEAGQITVHFERVPIEPLVQFAVAMVQPLAVTNRNVLHVHIDPNVHYLRTDLTRLRQILINLLNNACKFTEDGHITVRVTLNTHGTVAIITIEDTGIGMDAEVQSRLFREFEQGDASMTRRYGGTGLGLALSRRLAALLGGKISVVSAPGVGTTFTVTLPVTAHP